MKIGDPVAVGKARELAHVEAIGENGAVLVRLEHGERVAVQLEQLGDWPPEEHDGA